MSLVKCTECGTEVSDKAEKCVKCGCPMVKEEEKVFCIHCGNKISKSIGVCDTCKKSVFGTGKYCRKCGVEKRDIVAVVCSNCGGSLKSLEKNKSKTMKSSGWGLLGVFAVIMIGVLALKQSMNSESNIEAAKTAFSQPNKLTEKEYKEKALSVDYGDLLRTPKNYEGKILSVKCKVFQKNESLIMAFTKASNDLGEPIYYDDLIAVDYKGEGVIEGDIIRIYGEFIGLLTPKGATGVIITAPCVRAKYIEMIKSR